MDNVKGGYYLLIFGILFISAAIAVSPSQLTDSMMIPWQNVTNNPTERYSDEAGNYWYTYKATILVDDPLKTALKMANIQDPESLILDEKWTKWQKMWI